MKNIGKVFVAIFVVGGVAAALVGLIPFFFDNKAPIPILKIVPEEKYGYAPLLVVANGSESSDPDGDPLSYEWKINGNLEGEKSSLFETTLIEGGKYRIEFTVYNEKHRAAPRLELISVLPPLKDIEIPPLKSNLVIDEPRYTIVLPEEIITNGFQLEIKSGGLLAKNSKIVSFKTEKASNGNTGTSGQDGANGRGGGRHGGNGGHGGNGRDGGSGTNGKSAGEIIIETGFIAGQLTLINIGQGGGDGANGGNGGSGGDGADGRNRGGDTICSNDRSPGNGGNAGRGGNAGQGGNAGSGGSGGNVVIKTEDLDAIITINTSPGKAGSVGNPGSPGSAGNPGGMGRGSHCGGGGQGGNSNSAGATSDSGTEGQVGNKGEILVSVGGIEQIYDDPTTTLRRQK